MKYLLTIFLCLFSFFAYSQQIDSLLYIRCRNFQTISDSSLTINVLSKTEMKIWKDTTQKNTIFLDPKEEGSIKIALTNAQNDTVQIMNYKAVFLPLPIIVLYKNGKTVFSITLSKKIQEITAKGLPNTSKIVDKLINIDTESDGIKTDGRYRVNNYSAYLLRKGIEIDSTTSQYPTISLTEMIKKAKKGDKIILKIVNIRRMNYENKIVEDIPLNVEFEYTILD